MTVYISNYVIKVGGVTEALTFAVSFYGVKANRELSSKQAESPEHFSAMKTHSSVVASRCDSLHRPPPLLGTLHSSTRRCCPVSVSAFFTIFFLLHLVFIFLFSVQPCSHTVPHSLLRDTHIRAVFLFCIF